MAGFVSPGTSSMEASLESVAKQVERKGGQGRAQQACCVCDCGGRMLCAQGHTSWLKVAKVLEGLLQTPAPCYACSWA